MEPSETEPDGSPSPDSIACAMTCRASRGLLTANGGREATSSTRKAEQQPSDRVRSTRAPRSSMQRGPEDFRQSHGMQQARAVALHDPSHAAEGARSEERR